MGELGTMASSILAFLYICLAFVPLLATGDTCLSPAVETQVYTTGEASVSSDKEVNTEFNVTCKNGLKDLSLYAEFQGRTAPASRVAGTNKYQASFSQTHKKLPAGNYVVRVFDEEGYSNLRKAQRSGENTAEIKSLFDIPVAHQGAWSGPAVQSEFVAAAVAGLVWYLAYNERSKL